MDTQHIEIEEFFRSENVFLVVGATNHAEKYGSKVFLDLHENDFNAVAINLHDSEVHRTPAYPTITRFLERIEELFSLEKRMETIQKIVVVFVVPPQAAYEVLQEAHLHGITKAWFQPGSESEEAIGFCERRGIACVHHQCIMVERPRAGG